jgi:hypothetical protein
MPLVVNAVPLIHSTFLSSDIQFFAVAAASNKVQAARTSIEDDFVFTLLLVA